MKKGRKYIEPMLGKGDKKGTNIPEKKDKRKKADATWDGVSRPSNDSYRINWKTIFGKKLTQLRYGENPHQKSSIYVNDFNDQETGLK